MKTNRTLWFCCAISIAAMIGLAKDKVQTKAKSAVTATPAVPTPPAKKPDNVNKLPVIGHLETRDRIVTIQSSPNGLRYLVKTKDGTVLHENLSEDQLKAQAPEIHELIKTSVAGASSKNGAFMDARVGGVSK